jgi:hypothetical protein
MTDAGDVRFKVANFNSKNMAGLETNWDRVGQALKVSAQLLASFGFSDRTLTADSVLAPVSDYLFHRGLDQTYLTSAQHADDRERVRGWVIRSLLKAGVWGSGLDTLLVTIRRVVREHADSGFPVDEIQTAMAKAGKSLRFEREEIEDLVGSQYGKGRTFALLALLYPGIDVKNEFHVDHVFPQSRFKRTKLEQAGIATDDIAVFMDHVDRLPNLQLLEGPVNESKLATMPLEWAQQRYPDPQPRGLYLAGHDLDGLPAALTDFLTFFNLRKQRMVGKLLPMLGSEGEPRDDGAA